MILKNILGKTLDAAKKTAQQMYGDDFLVVDSSEASGDKPAKITVFSDKKPKKKSTQGGIKKSGKTVNSNKNGEKAGVSFEYSGKTNQSQENNKSSEKLNSLRRFAEQLEKQGNDSNALKLIQHEQQGKIQSEKSELKSSTTLNKNDETGTVYSRSAVRYKPQEDLGTESPYSKSKSENELNAEKPGQTDKAPLSNGETNDDSSTPFTFEERNSAIELPYRNDQREIKALHKRFNKLEALLDSSLISANLDYASHPAFQQLVRTGINTSIIAGWFSRIIGEGIDPFSQPEQFMTKLAGIIRSALGNDNYEKPQKFLLFVGPSGAGKTSLIMKLSQNPELMGNKKIAVVSVHPLKDSKESYYTILKPFCEDNAIPFYEIKRGFEINKHMKEWDDFDHILIDTPSINIEQNNSFREYWKIRQMLSPLTPLEVHYVANISLNRFYFRNSSAIHHPLQPDYIAITHLDEVSQWGPVIPFLEEMGCKARYTSKGDSLSNSLDEFNPHSFAQKILQEN